MVNIQNLLGLKRKKKLFDMTEQIISKNLVMHTKLFSAHSMQDKFKD
jgi:hypothetical protein